MAWESLSADAILFFVVGQAADFMDNWVLSALLILSGVIGAVLIRLILCHRLTKRVWVKSECLVFSRNGLLHYAQIVRTEVSPDDINMICSLRFFFSFVLEPG